MSLKKIGAPFYLGKRKSMNNRKNKRYRPHIGFVKRFRPNGCKLEAGLTFGSCRPTALSEKMGGRIYEIMHLVTPTSNCTPTEPGCQSVRLYTTYTGPL